MKMTKEFFAAQACAKIRAIVDASPFLTKISVNLIRLWDRSRILNTRRTQLARGFVFIHVPKTAGSSLKRTLVPFDTGRHECARELIPFLKYIAPDIISFAFVRNPFDRFISLYNYARLDESLHHSAKHPERAPFGKHLDYDILSDKSPEECAELLIEGKLGEPGIMPTIWHPQVEWLIDRHGKIVVDYIGRVESMEADLKQLQKLYGITCEPIPWLNKSTEKEKRPLLTERTYDLVRLFYKRDFEMLGYDENPDAPRHATLLPQAGT